MSRSILILLVLSSYLLGACKTKVQNLPSTSLSASYQFLDSTAASLFIVEDKTEQFFDKIQSLDASIQQGKTCHHAVQCIADYKDLLQSEVMSFTPADKKIMTTVMDSALSLVRNINPRLLNKSIKLIKVRAKAYGPSVYYTRDEGIIIPYNVLEEIVFEDLLSVMLHEISHIISRYHPEFKETLYATIGFKRYNKTLEIPEVLKSRLLHNPDGLNLDYAIDLENEGKTVRALPLIISNVSKFDPERNGFFSYLKFDIYQIEDQGTHYKVLCKENGLSSLDPRFMSSFFAQIKDNTQYIIHPDEILADNFMLLAMANGNLNKSEFSEEGLVLIKQIETQLRNFK